MGDYLKTCPVLARDVVNEGLVDLMFIVHYFSSDCFSWHDEFCRESVRALFESIRSITAEHFCHWQRVGTVYEEVAEFMSECRPTWP